MYRYNKNLNNSTYSTRDLAEASALLTKSQKLLKIDRKGNVCWFVFADKSTCEEIASKFWFGECTANLKDYHESMQTLKNKIFQ